MKHCASEKYTVQQHTHDHESSVCPSCVLSARTERFLRKPPVVVNKASGLGGMIVPNVVPRPPALQLATCYIGMV